MLQTPFYDLFITEQLQCHTQDNIFTQLIEWMDILCNSSDFLAHTVVFVIKDLS